LLFRGGREVSPVTSGKNLLNRSDRWPLATKTYNKGGEKGGAREAAQEEGKAILKKRGYTKTNSATENTAAKGKEIQRSQLEIGCHRLVRSFEGLQVDAQKKRGR